MRDVGRGAAVFALLSVLAAVAAGPAAFADPSAASVSVSSGSSVRGCEADASCYEPNVVTVDAGGEVVWTVDDTAAHTVASGNAQGGQDGAFFSGLMQPGSTFGHTFGEPGRYSYYCVVYPWMAGTVVVQSADAAIPDAVASANNRFALDFYNEMSAGGGNLFFSPISIYMAFSMLYEGAGNNTAAEMESVFGMNPDDAARLDSVSDTIKSINRDDPGAALSMANSLWLADWLEPRDSYVNATTAAYGAEVAAVDFAADGDGVADRINRWAGNSTNGTINRIVSPNDITDDTAAILASAIHFSGTWDAAFPEALTGEGDFYPSPGRSVKADFMQADGRFPYLKSDGMEILRLPYSGNRLSMVVLLPEESGRFENVTAGRIGTWTDGLLYYDVHVRMPKFNMSVEYNLVPALKRLGVNDAFSPSAADLSGIVGPPAGDRTENRTAAAGNMHVTSAAHAAYVDVNESGTEAAAVTTIGAGITSAGPPSASFNADRPFLFVIQDDDSGTILFMGRVSAP